MKGSARLLAIVVLALVLFIVHACVTTVYHLQTQLLGPGIRSAARPTP